MEYRYLKTLNEKKKVYKADDKGHSWKWVANNNSEIHLFPTKKEAVEFVKVKFMFEGCK